MSALTTWLASLAANAGFPPAAIATAAAVAMAESSGNSNAVGDNGTSYGLWQIHLPAHPEFAGWDLSDPQTNANAAYHAWQSAGGSFSPWTTFKTGAYEAFLSAASAAGATMDEFSSPFTTALLAGALGIVALWVLEEAVG